MNVKDVEAIAAIIANTRSGRGAGREYVPKWLLDDLADYFAANACSTGSTRCPSCFDRAAFLAACYSTGVKP